MTVVVETAAVDTTETSEDVVWVVIVLTEDEVVEVVEVVVRA